MMAREKFLPTKIKLSFGGLRSAKNGNFQKNFLKYFEAKSSVRLVASKKKKLNPPKKELNKKKNPVLLNKRKKNVVTEIENFLLSH